MTRILLKIWCNAGKFLKLCKYDNDDVDDDYEKKKNDLEKESEISLQLSVMKISELNVYQSEVMKTKMGSSNDNKN